MNTKTKQNYYEQAVSYFNAGQLELAKKNALKQLTKQANDINALKLLAFIEYQSGNFPDALKQLEKINRLDDSIAEINNLTGCVYLQTGEIGRSVEFLSRAIECDSHYLDAYTNLSQALQNLNHPQEALQILQAALSIAPDSPTVLAQLAQLSFALGDYNTSTHTYENWLALEPANLAANAGLARSLLAEDNVDRVLELLGKLKNFPDKSPLARLDVTNELLHRGKSTEAINSYTELLDTFKEKEFLYNNIASAYDHLDDTDKAIEYFLKAINENNAYTPAYLNVGRIYTDIMEFDLAEKHLRKALDLEPDNVNALINFGRLQDSLGEPTKGKSCFEKAIEIEPNNAIAHSNLGNALHQLGEFEASCQSYKNCLTIDPNYGDADQNLGINELAMGKFDTAWGHYFKRIRNMERGEQLSPITPGMSLSEKHVYFCRSQGIGDEIFFLRFLPVLKKQNLTITYRASKKAFPLLSQIEEIDNLINEDDEIPVCDFYFTIDDIPLILNIDDVSKIAPSLRFKPNDNAVKKASEILSQFPAPYIGITWRAGTQQNRTSFKNNQRHLNKNFSLATLAEIVAPLSGSIVILQRQPEQEEIEQLKTMSKSPVIDLSAWNESLDEMLALLSLLDNYIGVSNTNMHLLAALGKTAEVMVPFPPDWRWMVNGSSSPWFPGFGVFRQDANRNWLQAIEDVKQKLDKNKNGN